MPMVALTLAFRCAHSSEGRGPCFPSQALGFGLFCREFYILPGIALWNNQYLQGFQKGWVPAPRPEVMRLKTSVSRPRYSPRIN